MEICYVVHVEDNDDKVLEYEKELFAKFSSYLKPMKPLKM